MRALLVAALVLVAPGLALAGERTLVVKTYEIEDQPDPNPSFCADAEFDGNITLYASVWSLMTHPKTGEVKREAVKKLGTAHACGKMTTPTPFTSGQLFMIQFDLPEGSYRAAGTCDIVSITVPATGVLLAGCALRIEDAPPGVLGGLVTSASVFNPYSIPGFGTGSVWTLHLYTED
jgi:hypothetical protein